MAGHLLKGVLLACAASCIACGSDAGLGPISNKAPTGPVAEAPVLTAVEISPSVDSVYEGFATQLLVTFRSQSGDRMFTNSGINYATSAPEIATVSATGVVTAIAPGTAIISATTSIRGTTKTGVMTTTVRQSDPADLVLTSDSRGWLPSVAYVKAGGTVLWRASAIGWSGVPNATLWLMNADYTQSGSVPFTAGIAKMKFDVPGVIRYCSGGCWDPPDFGVIYVQ